MIRLLFWFLLFALAWWFWRKATRAQTPARRSADEQAAPMVRCAECGVHVPRASALQHEQNWYCSRAHLPRDTPPHG